MQLGCRKASRIKTGRQVGMQAGRQGRRQTGKDASSQERRQAGRQGEAGRQ
jgi:hypothetical protein